MESNFVLLLFLQKLMASHSQQSIITQTRFLQRTLRLWKGASFAD